MKLRTTVTPELARVLAFACLGFCVTWVALAVLFGFIIGRWACALCLLVSAVFYGLMYVFGRGAEAMEREGAPHAR